MPDCRDAVRLPFILSLGQQRGRSVAGKREEEEEEDEERGGGVFLFLYQLQNSPLKNLQGKRNL